MKPLSFRSALFLSLIIAVLAGAARAEDRDVVKVNGTPIRESEVMQKLWQRYGPDTLDEMVDELLLRQEAAKKKIKADPVEVDRRLSRLREQLPDPKSLESQLQQNGSSIEKLKQELSDQVSLEKLVSSEKKIAVPEADVKDAFEKHKDELGRPEAVHLRHIMIASKDEADGLVKQIRGGADFKALARDKSLAPTGKMNGGDYGFVTRGMLPPEIEQVAFALKPGELKAFESGKGWHILQAVERRASEPASFAKVKDDVRQALLEERIKAVLPAYKHELRARADIQPQGR